MRYETSWKSRAVGAAATPGRGIEAEGLRAFRDRRDAEDHAPERLSLGPCMSATRREGPNRQASAGSALETERPAEARLGQVRAEGSRCIWLWHRVVDVSACKAVDRATLWRALPRRSHSKAAGVVGFVCLGRPGASRSNAMKRLLNGRFTTTGLGSSIGRPNTGFTSYSSTELNPNEYARAYLNRDFLADCCRSHQEQLRAKVTAAGNETSDQQPSLLSLVCATASPTILCQ